MSKKVLSLVLSVLLIMNVASFVTTAAPAPDVKGTAYDEAVAILTDMGIMSLKDDGTFDAAGDITVGEYVDAVLKLIRVDASGAEAKARFSDVPATHAYAKQIELAYQLNIYKGKSADSYGADDKLTMSVALRILLNATGYGEYAKIKGGDPYGYAVVANEKDIIKNSPSESATVSRGVAADMIYNALFLNIMVPSTKSNGETSYTEDGNRTILSSIHGAYKTTGVINGNAYLTLPAGKGLPAGNVMIDGVVYTAGSIAADKYLGYYVTAIYTTDKGYRQLLGLSPSYIKNTVYTYDLEDIQAITPTEIVYFPDDAKRETKYELAKFTPIYNNFSFAAMADSFNYIIPDCGDITLIDNNNDGKYEVVLIDSYETLVVSSLDKANMMLYGKYTLDPIELSAYAKYEIKDPAGKIVKFADIKKDDIAMVKSYPDEKFLEIQLLRTMETLTIDEITQSGTTEYPNKIKFKSAGKEYTVAASFYKAKAPSKLELGAKYDVYFDIKGDIANMYKKGAESLQFGYLVKGAITSTGIEKTLEVMIYTLDGQFITVKSGEKLVYSGTCSKGNISSQKLPFADVHQYLYENNGSGFNDGFNSYIDSNGRPALYPYSETSKVGAMGIRYRLAEDKTLLAIETAYKDIFADGFRVAGSIGSTTRRYKNVSKLIGGYIMMGTDTKGLDVANAKESDTQALYSTRLTIANEGYYGNVQAYSTTLDSAAAQYLVRQVGGASGTLDTDDPAYVFVKYTETYDPTTDQSGKGVVLYDSGDFVTYPIDPTTNDEAKFDELGAGCYLDKDGYFMVTPYGGRPQKLQPGDVIRPVFNGKNEIMTGTEFMFDATKQAIVLQNKNQEMTIDGVVTFYGKIFRRLGNGGYGSIDGGKTYRNTIYNFDTAKTVVVVDRNETREARKFAIGSVDDIKTVYDVGAERPERATDVFAFIREGGFKLVVLYK